MGVHSWNNAVAGTTLTWRPSLITSAGEISKSWDCWLGLYPCLEKCLRLWLFVTQSCASLWDPVDCRHARLPYAWLQADQGTQYLCFIFISWKAMEITGSWGLSLCPEAPDQRGDFLPALCASVSSSLKRIKDDLVLQHWERWWAINGHEATGGPYAWLRKGP